jgi:hypothetical protein
VKPGRPGDQCATYFVHCSIAAAEVVLRAVNFGFFDLRVLESFM